MTQIGMGRTFTLLRQDFKHLETGLIIGILVDLRNVNKKTWTRTDIS